MLNMTNLCNICFMSNYCFINEVNIEVNDYIKQNCKKKITCRQGHELILVNGDKRKPHFRHKHSEDLGGNPISELFEDQLHTDLFNARCHDTGETTNGNIQVHLFHFS